MKLHYLPPLFLSLILLCYNTLVHLSLARDLRLLNNIETPQTFGATNLRVVKIDRGILKQYGKHV